MKTKNYAVRVLNGREIIQKVWITFVSNGFQKHWLPLEDWDGNQLFWSEDDIKDIKQVAREKFPETSWGLSYCEQKELNNACIDNL